MHSIWLLLIELALWQVDAHSPAERRLAPFFLARRRRSLSYGQNGVKTSTTSTTTIPIPPGWVAGRCAPIVPRKFRGGIDVVLAACAEDPDCKGVEYRRHGVLPYGHKCGMHGKQFRLRAGLGATFGFISVDLSQHEKNDIFVCKRKYCNHLAIEHGAAWEWRHPAGPTRVDPAQCKQECRARPGCTGVSFQRAGSWCLFWFLHHCEVFSDDPALLESRFDQPDKNVVTCSLTADNTMATTTSTTTPPSNVTVYCGDRRVAKSCEECRVAGQFPHEWCRGQCHWHSLPNHESCVLGTFCNSTIKAVDCSQCPEDTCSGMCRRNAAGQCERRPQRWTRGDCKCRWRWQRHSDDVQCTSYCCNPDKDRLGDWCAVDNSTESKCDKEWDYCEPEGYLPLDLRPPDYEPPTTTPVPPLCYEEERTLCPGTRYHCIGKQCCRDGSVCPSAPSGWNYCPKPRQYGCSTRHSSSRGIVSSCNVGDTVRCPGKGFCAGKQCCLDGSVCPSAPAGWNSCLKLKAFDCTSSIAV